jgi:hypothetical protein
MAELAALDYKLFSFNYFSLWAKCGVERRTPENITPLYSALLRIRAER